MDNKTVKVIFKEGWETMYSNDLTQGDYGRVLQVEGITLPDGNVEVHFSLTEHNGEAPISIGTVKDNVITVDIPDFILTKNNTYNSSYEAYAWIYVTDGESGRTIRKIVFTIDTRAEPTTNVPEDKKDPFLEEVRQVMAETKEIAQSVRNDADNGKFSGIPGKKGDDGKSAYQYAVEGGFKGTEQEFIDLMAQAGHVDLTGYVTKEQHEAELLKTMVKVTTDKAPFHHITDSANYRVLDFGMEGKIEQKTTSGKNLYSGGDVSGVGGSPDVIINTLSAGTYTVSAIVSSTDTDYEECLVYFSNGEGYATGKTLKRVGRASATITFTSDVNRVAFYASINNNYSTDDTFSFTDIQIELGSVATDYEPFTNGPTPNPDFPQEIVNAGRRSKNLFDVNKAKDEGNYIWGSIYPYFPVYVGAGNTITFSCNLSNATNYPRTVTIFDAVDGNNLSYIWHNENTTLQKDEVTVTSPNDYIYIRLGCLQTETLLWLDFITDIQIELGSVATEYEPYSDDYKIGCEVVGKNLWDAEYASDTHNWSLGYGTQYPSIPIKVIPGIPLTISYNKLDAGITGLYVLASIGDNEGNYTWLYHTTASSLIKNPVTITPTKDVIYIGVAAANENQTYTDKFMQYIGNDLQIEIADASTDLVSHASQPFTLTSPVPLTMWDYLTKRDGVWGWSIWQLLISLNGSSGLSVYDNISEYAGFQTTGISQLPMSVRRDGYCNQLRVNTQQTSLDNGLWIGAGNRSLYLINNSFYDETLEDKGLANLKTHLAEHPLEIVTYADEEQSFIPLPDEEQTLLNNLETYYGVTNVYNEQGCPMWLTYVADQELHWNQKLLQIQQALI